MLFKYTVSGTPTTAIDFAEDVAKLLSGETNVNNLSANCDKVSSGFEANTTPMSSVNPFTIEDVGATQVVFKRPHPDNPAVQMWNFLRTSGDEVQPGMAQDGTGGVLVNDWISNLTNFNLNTTGTVVYILANAYDWFITQSTFQFSTGVSLWPTSLSHLNPTNNNTVCPFLQSGIYFGTSQDLFQFNKLRSGVSFEGLFDITSGQQTINRINYDDDFYKSYSLSNSVKTKLSDGSVGLYVSKLDIGMAVTTVGNASKGYSVGHFNFGMTYFSDLSGNVGKLFTNPVSGLPRLLIYGESGLGAFVEV